MWDPGFEFDVRSVARLAGYARSFCMRSIHHRGTVEHPGLVLALDEIEGANCDGLAFEIAQKNQAATLAYLRERELISSAYLEKTLPIELADGQKIKAVTYVVDPEHAQYCGGLQFAEQAHIIADATGGRGPNADYLHNTARHLHELGINDPDLDWLSAEVDNIRGLSTK